MWFKNMNIYSIEGDFPDESVLADALSNYPYTPCSALEEKRSGWVSPLGDDHDMLVHSAMGNHIISLKIEEKTIPASVIKEELEKRLAAYRQQNPGSKVSGKYKTQLKETIRSELLPRAFSKITRVNAYYNKASNLFIVDTSSAAKAENLVMFMKSCLDVSGLIFRPAQTNDSPAEAMREWLLNMELPEDFQLGTDCLLKSLAESGTIKYGKVDLDDENLREYLGQDKEVSLLQLNLEDCISFSLTSDFQIKSVKFGDLIKEERSEVEADSREESFDADFCIMCDNHHRLIQAVTSVLGGITKPELEEAA